MAWEIPQRDTGMKVTNHHNPACGTLRNVSALIRYSGIEPIISNYMKRARPGAEGKENWA